LLPEDQIFDVRYPELVADPSGSISRLYAWLGIDLHGSVLDGIESFLAKRPQDKHGLHQYGFADTGLELGTERAKYLRYQERFGVASEI
jgi:hypothetical protein